MKNIMGLCAVLLAFPASAGVFDHSDGYTKKKQGVEPYATHFSGAEIHCITEGYSWPGFLTGERAAQLQTSEMVLCIEKEINNRVLADVKEVNETNTRLLEIELMLQKLMDERKSLLKNETT